MFPTGNGPGEDAWLGLVFGHMCELIKSRPLRGSGPLLGAGLKSTVVDA